MFDIRKYISAYQKSPNGNGKNTNWNEKYPIDIDLGQSDNGKNESDNGKNPC